MNLIRGRMVGLVELLSASYRIAQLQLLRCVSLWKESADALLIGVLKYST